MKTKKNLLREYLESIGIAIIAALIIRALFIQAFRIPTGSMEKTLLIGDFLLVNKFVYGVHIPFTDWKLPGITEPKPGDVVIFKYPKDRSLDYIKRCVAVGGQTVEIIDKVLYVDGKPFNETLSTQHIYNLMPKGVPDPGIFPEGSNYNRDNYGPFIVPDGYLFMMGDNRDNSLDSRYWGPLPEEYVIGKALVVYWSWDYSISYKEFIKKIRWNRIGDFIN